MYKLRLSEIFRLYGDSRLLRYQDQIPPCHRKIIHDIMNCRTPNMGGNRYAGPQCRIVHYACHSCNNRRCPKCGGDKTRLRLKKQLDRLLSVPYFFLTFTIPEAFHTIFRSHQRMAVSIPRNPAQSFNFRTGLFGSFSPGQKSLPEHRHRLNIRNQ